MENSFSSTMPIEDESDIHEAKIWIIGAVHKMAHARGISISPEQVVLNTVFGVIDDDGSRRLQGVLTIN